jgi:hypothetical protein
MKSASTESPAKMSVKSVLASHGSEGGQRKHEADGQEPQWLADAEHAQRQLQNPKRCQRLHPEIDPESGILAEMEVEPNAGERLGTR